MASFSLPFLSPPSLLLLRRPSPLVSLSSPKPPFPTDEDEILDAISQSDGASLPALRTFRHGGARLSLSGTASARQAMAAGASDGGKTAAQYVAEGRELMVVETTVPGEECSTSTRLFLPARKVKEKAKMIRRVEGDFFFDSTSESTLAITFRQVLLSHVWNIELLMHRPGAERNRKELNNSKEVSASFTLSSLDDRVISVLAEVICRIALENTEKMFLDNSWSISPSGFFRLFQKPNIVASNDSTVIIYKLYEDEIIASAQSLLKTFKSGKSNYKPSEVMEKNSWWSLSTYSKLEKISGPEFSTWVNEYVPAYRLQVDPNRFPELKLEGWRQIEENRWEVLLTHSQMVDLANVLDMYYEDIYTLPGKQISCDSAPSKSTDFSSKKRTGSLLKMLSVTLASGVFLVTLGIFGQLYLPYLRKGKGFQRENMSIQSSITHNMQPQHIEATKVEEFCALIVYKIKDAFRWTGDVQTKKNVGAWIGTLPIYLKIFDESGYNDRKISSTSSLLKDSDEKLKASAQDIASYQVVMSAEGKIIGFQPTSRVAVNQWATNPLAKELYGGRKLNPGFIEPGLKIPRPDEVAVIELLMSTNPDSSFALARPSR